MGEKDDGLGLGLSLSLGLGTNQPSSFKESLMQKPSRTLPNQRGSWNDIFRLRDRSCETRTLLRGVDVNLAPPSTVVDCDDENGVSSPNSTLSSISGKRSERESIGGEHEAERASCSPGSDEDDGGGGGGDGDGDGEGDTSRKKLRLSKEQSIVLEETFKEHNTLNPKQKQELAKQLNLRPRQVEVWFQNRRARTKLKQTEVDCEYLRRCCENLTEENRRLQKEVQELRALKLSPQFYMHMNPPTTLTMCPSCERVAVSSASSASSATGTPSTMAPTNCTPSGSSIQRPVPLLPWATSSIQNRPFDGLNPRP